VSSGPGCTRTARAPSWPPRVGRSPVAPQSHAGRSAPRVRQCSSNHRLATGDVGGPIATLIAARARRTADPFDRHGTAALDQADERDPSSRRSLPAPHADSRTTEGQPDRACHRRCSARPKRLPTTVLTSWMGHVHNVAEALARHKIVGERKRSCRRTQPESPGPKSRSLTSLRAPLRGKRQCGQYGVGAWDWGESGSQVDRCTAPASSHVRAR